MGTVTIPNRPAGSDSRSIATILADFDALATFINGSNLDGDNFSDALVNTPLGLTDSGAIRRGKSIVSTTEVRNNVAYGLMPTPDRVQNVVLPSGGLIFIAYQATWQESVSQAARAAIFIGANQLVGTVNATTSTLATSMTSGDAVARDRPLSSYWGGLASAGQNQPTYAGDATTGQIVGLMDSFAVTEIAGGTPSSNTDPLGLGGPCVVFAAAGTYDISIQFKASSGNVTVKNRKLWVWTMGF